VQEALNSPLLNDNDISGAQYVLLNITYGDKEVLMDEITEITDYIQDEAGSTADVIWGHGYDATLGDKLSVTLIATGFSSQPVNGFEKAPEKMVRKLEDEPKNEIKAPLAAPTQVNTFNNATEITNTAEEPFLKNDTASVAQTPIDASFLHEETKEQKEMQFDWEMSHPTSQEAPQKEEVVRLWLEDEMEQKISLETTPAKSILSPEEQQRRTQDRLSKIQEYTSKLKKAEGITEFENEPAFVRRNIQLDNSARSSEESFSRFGLSQDENGTTIRNNNFLHDNVD